MAVEAFGGRYHATHELTRTGSVVVHAAEDRWLHRAVALAVHDPETGPDGAGVETSPSGFQALGRILMRVAHPNVVDAYDAGRQGGSMFVAFERPPRDLAHELAAGPWEEQRLLALAAELTAALAVLHAEGACLDLLHPGAVGLSADGRVRLAPWSLAPPPGGWGGEGAWLAPERLDGAPPTVHADVWSAGAVLLSAMIGAGPGRLDDDGVADVSGRIRRTLDPTLVAATARSLRREPSARFPSAEAMGTALDPPADPVVTALPGQGQRPQPLVPPRVRTRPLRVPAPGMGRWGWRAAAALVAGMFLPFLALQLESAAPSVASCRSGAAHHGTCPGRVKGSAVGRHVVAATPASASPQVHIESAGAEPVALGATESPHPLATPPTEPRTVTGPPPGPPAAARAGRSVPSRPATGPATAPPASAGHGQPATGPASAPGAGDHGHRGDRARADRADTAR